MARILCVDDERAALERVEAALGQVGHETVSVENLDAALTVLARGDVDLVISDYRMPAGSGLGLLKAMAEQGMDMPLIMVTGHGSIEHAVESMKEGAVDYLTKPWTPEALRIAVDRALRVMRLRRENEALKREINKLKVNDSIVGDSAKLRQVLDTIALVAPTRSTVLLTGESGTGKEVLAKTLHEQSERRDGPFISINCAAIPDTLVESTLFGHERGAFTGAHRRVEGAFERAHNGTLLLDEVSEMRLETQAKLLRVLQEQEFERVGGSRAVKVDVRIVATSNRNMEEFVREGRFREDLFYRLSVVPLRVPPLRERRDDIPLLVRHFAARVAAANGRPVPAVSDAALDVLVAYDWPGNVRELSHAVERALVLEQGDSLTLAALRRAGVEPASEPYLVEANGQSRRELTALDGVFLRLNSHRLDEAEQELIRLAMSATDENKTHAAGLLGINVRTLRKKLNQPADTTG
ncbi:MAG: sigma-54-dependent Fis family transcriptional regulator [Gemmatimonadetes bacterium]|nr:sigma-54-dependent Fis family transcriptional regulator [Gemmatimonadota bacterium]